jgi:AcrR family transcriptional regulator
MAADQRREHLLDAALAVIVQQGYSRVSVEAVAREAGVTRPVVYDHFRDLGELLHALNEREVRSSVKQLEGVLPDNPHDGHPSEVLSESVARFLDVVASRPATWTLILLPPEGTPESVRQHVEANRARMRERMEVVVRWAIQRTRAGRAAAEDDGEPHRRRRSDHTDPVDVELAARAILGLAEDAARMVLTDPEAYPPERWSKFVQSVMKLLWPE